MLVESHGLVAGIPAIFWGPERPRRLIAVHGFGGSKGDGAIRLLARRAVPLGWQVVSCDLPGHGNRRHPLCPYTPKGCVEDLRRLLPAVERGETALFAQGAGAQWALMAYQGVRLSRALLLSPAVGPGLPLDRWQTPTAILALPGECPSPFGTPEGFAAKYHCSFTFTPAPSADALEGWLGKMLA